MALYPLLLLPQSGSGSGICFDLWVLETLVLWRPVGQAELDLIAKSGWRTFPPRLDGQPIFYPVLNEECATKIARDWNAKDPLSGLAGYVLRFEVERPYVERFQVRQVGGRGIEELWVPAEELPEFNRHIVGTIELVAEYC